MIPILALSAFDIPWQKYGNKAHYLSLLRRYGFDVPDGYALPALLPGDSIAYLENESIQWKIEALLHQLTSRQDISDRIIVRSSSLLEDTAQTAAPGRYLTKVCEATSESVFAALREVYVSGAEDPHTRMGVVLQVLVAAHTSGIAYSCDPVTLERDTIVVESIPGLGTPLVEGKAPSNKVVVSYRNGLLRILDGVVSSHGVLDALVADVSRIEALFRRPVDVEWCVDESGRRYILQARPIVLGPSLNEGWLDVTTKHEPAMPPQLLAHEKVVMRLTAERLGIYASPAQVFWRMDRQFRTPNTIPFQTDTTTDLMGSRPTARSIVVIQPRTVGGMIRREFIPTSATKPSPSSNYVSQKIVRYPTYATRDDVVNDMVAEALRTHWLAGVIVQDVFDVSHTGILARHQNGWLLEIAQGHFTSKGEVPASSFVLSSSFHVISKKSARRDFN